MGYDMRFLSLCHLRISGYEIGRSTTASTNDIDQSFVDKLGNLGRHTFWCLVVGTHLVGQSGIGMRTNIIRCNLSHPLYERLHLRGTESTVHAYREDRIRRQTGKESLYRLSAEGSSCQVANGETHHHRQLHATFLHHREGCVYHCLAVECIENRLDEDHIHPSLYQAVYLFAAVVEEFVVSDVACSRIAHIRTHGTRLVGGSHVACHKSWFIGCRELICLYPCQPCALVSHLAGIILQMIVGLRDTLRREGVGRDDVGSCL